MSREQDSKRVLVVEDDRFVGAAIRGMLAPHYDVVVAQGAKAAQVVLADDQRFDVVLSDLRMPDIDGAELHRWIAARWPELAARVVFVTGGPLSSRHREFFERVPNPWLEKPVERHQLLGWLRLMLR